MSSALFEPIALRGVELPNRIVVSPMCQYGSEDGNASEWHTIHLGSLSMSGVGLLILEATGVEPRGRITPKCLGLWSDENEASLGRVLDLCREYGSATLGIQLGHAGRKASVRPPFEGGTPLEPGEGAWTTVAPSPIPFEDGWHTPEELDRAGMDEVIAAFVQAARRADRIGLQLIEIHAAHGYFLSEFLSPLANRRSDAYGGSLANRMRFPLEVFEAVRAAFDDQKPVGIRFNGTDWHEEGLGPDDAVAFAKELKALGCDYACLSSGGNVNVRIPLKPGYQVEFATRVRIESGLPTMAVGMIREPALAERIVAEGKADMLALARGFLYEPHWGWRAAEELGGEIVYPIRYGRGAPARWPQAFEHRSAAE